MLFVPLPLFATLVLVFVFARFVSSRDMTARPHQLFAALIALYAIQSLLTSLRWGYGISGAAIIMAVLAPVLPAVAYLAYQTLSGRQRGLQWWPLAVVAVNWAVFAVAPSLADPLILMTYLGFGAVLLRLYWRGEDQLTLSPINDAREILMAMGLTGAILIASGLTDVYVIYDFIKTDGRNAGLVLTFAQTFFVLVIGVSALFGKASAAPDKEIETPQQPTQDVTEADEEILKRLETLFARDRLHTTEDLSVRRLSRRLGVPDRHVSNAVNRIKHMSVSQFVNEYRIKEACRLLRETDETVLTISLAAGFATKSNFNREFSRVTGQTPSQWRSANKAP
ncbi:MAG: helix-turn-helix domain-containing protein [Sulfitobacter sp.]|nr:helix-turn-helix domain-containing protein [Sulfitobacter sp.]